MYIHIYICVCVCVVVRRYWYYVLAIEFHNQHFVVGVVCVHLFCDDPVDIRHVGHYFAKFGMSFHFLGDSIYHFAF